MKGFVGTVVGGAIGITALYLAAHIAYRIGYEMARTESHYEDLCKESRQKEATVPQKTDDGTEIEDPPVHALRRRSWMPSFGRITSTKASIIGNLIRNPEAHRIEAQVDSGTLNITIRPRAV